MAKPRARQTRRKEADQAASRKEPVDQVAAIPKAAQPVAKPRSNEPAPQKPIMTLPADAIRNAKRAAGTVEQFTKQQDRNANQETGRHRKRAKPSNWAERSAVQWTPGRDRRRGKPEEACAAGERRNARQEVGHAWPAVEPPRQQKRRRTQSGRGRRRSGCPPAPSPVDAQRHQYRRSRKGKVTVELPCTVRSLSEATGVPTVSHPTDVDGIGTMATINQELDPETAELIAAELEHGSRVQASRVTGRTLITQIRRSRTTPIRWSPGRPIDHVSWARRSRQDFAAGSHHWHRCGLGRSGWHHAAHSCLQDSQRRSRDRFVDTPGHEAFTEMRARGANVTDIAVLVWPPMMASCRKPRRRSATLEPRRVPIVVALNKIDLPGADPNEPCRNCRRTNCCPRNGAVMSKWSRPVQSPAKASTTCWKRCC